jgi:hypothetical protein
MFRGIFAMAIEQQCIVILALSAVEGEESMHFIRYAKVYAIGKNALWPVESPGVFSKTGDLFGVETLKLYPSGVALHTRE